MTVALTHDRAAAVDQTYFWRPMNTCPLGTKVLLLTDGGVAIFGNVSTHTRKHFEGWAPLPKKP
jgi:hypothetical protein